MVISKKSIVLVLAVLLAISFVFVACSSKNSENTDTTTTSAEETDLEDVDTEYGYETEAVTDEDGTEVTDEDGNVVTTEVAVIYKTNEDGNTYAQKIDSDGEPVTNKKGNPVTVKTTYKSSSSSDSSDSDSSDSDLGGFGSSSSSSGSSSDSSTTTTKKEETTATTKKSVSLTENSATTKFTGTEVVPKTSDTGDEVSFSLADQEIIASMLEVPYLYLENYENSEGVPVETAVYTAVWMAQRDGGTATGKDNSYAANPIILDLFKYYGNTVVNFKTKCNSVEDTPITYSNNKFIISSFPSKKQTVVIKKIEDLGNNNFYKVTGTVSDADRITKVVAVIQKNRLEPTLGFSIKGLKWS
ncbi:MAG: hypothetical protein LUG95_06145 [Clostridiales bacterium]|nr:hypothetical protein [Clostridiales bacterium]